MGQCQTAPWCPSLTHSFLSYMKSLAYGSSPLSSDGVWPYRFWEWPQRELWVSLSFSGDRVTSCVSTGVLWVPQASCHLYKGLFRLSWTSSPVKRDDVGTWMVNPQTAVIWKIWNSQLKVFPSHAVGQHLDKNRCYVEPRRVLQLSPLENLLKNPFRFQVELFEFYVEQCPQRVLHGTKKGSPMGTDEEPYCCGRVW